MPLKTKEEWSQEVILQQNFNASTWQHQELILAIQLNALEYAAEIAGPQTCWPECHADFCDGRNFAKNIILSTAEKLKKGENV